MFLVNLSIGLDTRSTTAVYQSVLLAAGIGTGAALQALLGAWLINRQVNLPSGLVTPRVRITISVGVACRGS